ncbi:Hypp9762 [Branchiostoma lanceolatum]|uniref:Hypp9762 protein n=1 Tax=Branchiostoma lanceolatum TaxID=7740 RepID=A0A8S4MPL9_BRALA|nr:Hypp9762 [Branchiostoma lanceolatum]
MIRSALFRLFAHIARADPPLEPADLLREPTPNTWTRPRGRPRRTWGDQLKEDLLTAGLTLDTAWDVARDRSTLRTICRGAMLPSGARGLE